MQILNSQIDLQTSYSFFQEIKQSQSLEYWAGSHPPPGNQLVQAPSQKDVDRLTLSQIPHQRTSQNMPKSADSTSPLKDEPGKDQDTDPKINILVAVIEALTGKKVQLTHPEDLFFKGAGAPSPVQQSAGKTSGAPEQEAPDPGYGFSYSASQTITQTESLTISASGTLNTAKGKIDFDLEVALSQSFVQSQEINILGGNALKDPLIVNYAADTAQLTKQKFSFDLDLDMQPEQIHFPGPGRGFLALDKNNDGKINSGRELFGPTTGHGFRELAAYDSDQNNWLDEQDPVFPLLKVWSKDDKGNNRLFALGEIGIGAISLSPLLSQFHLGGKNLQGILAASGLFFKNNGQPGLIQEINLKV